MNPALLVGVVAKASSTTNTNPLVTFLPLILIGVVFYFLLIRPQHRRAPAPREPPAPEAARPEPLTMADIRDNAELSMFISAADRVMKGLGYTEHGFRHANLSGRISYNLMSRLGFDEHTSNLASVAGYL